jgi:hypothetical protein
VAQVPQRNEIPEFWKQIWKHQVEHIVLLDDSSATVKYCQYEYCDFHYVIFRSTGPKETRSRLMISISC